MVDRIIAVLGLAVGLVGLTVGSFGLKITREVSETSDKNQRDIRSAISEVEGVGTRVLNLAGEIHDDIGTGVLAENEEGSAPATGGPSATATSLPLDAATQITTSISSPDTVAPTTAPPATVESSTTIAPTTTSSSGSDVEREHGESAERRVVVSRGADAGSHGDCPQGERCYWMRIEYQGFGDMPHEVKCATLNLPRSLSNHVDRDNHEVWAVYRTEKNPTNGCIYWLEGNDVYAIVDGVRSDDFYWE